MEIFIGFSVHGSVKAEINALGELAAFIRLRDADGNRLPKPTIVGRVWLSDMTTIKHRPDHRSRPSPEDVTADAASSPHCTAWVGALRQKLRPVDFSRVRARR